MQKQAQDGAILAVPVRMADRRECSDEKSFHNVEIRRDGRMMVSFSRSKRRFRLTVETVVNGFGLGGLRKSPT